MGNLQQLKTLSLTQATPPLKLALLADIGLVDIYAKAHNIFMDNTDDLASVHDCVALNVLAGSRCALLVGNDGDDAHNAACAIGLRIVFGEWSALPCDHVKPYACADAEGNNLQFGTNP
eukprot:gene5633-6817_t